MKTPPLLLAAALIFWGWQSDLLLAGAAMALGLESSRLSKARWETTDADVIRIRNFCFMLALATAIYAFTSNEGPANFSKMFEDASFQASRQAGNSSTQAAISLMRWLPMDFFAFAAAQAFSSRPDFPLETISPYLQYRRQRRLKSGRPAVRPYHFNASWPYFALCLFAASAHAAEPGDKSFFWGICGLIAWALWSQRPPGSAKYIWLGLLAGVIASGFFGQEGLGQLSRLTDFADNYNPQWLSRFLVNKTDPAQGRTAIGHIGKLKESSAIVLRVSPVNGVEVPAYLRESTYRTYHSQDFAQTWFAGGPADDFTPVSETPPNSEHWVLQAGRTNRAAVNISCYLNGVNTKDGNALGLLPLPVDCDQLQRLPAYALQNNPIGAVLAEGPGLVIFNATYGSGSTLDAAPGPLDLEVPTAEKPALDRVVSQLAATNDNEPKKIIAVSHYFAAHYQYSLWQGNPQSANTNGTPLADFLLRTHSGHCEYFATATVLLLRDLKIPARYAVGYYVHEASGHHYVVRERDAHAWCLVWDPAAKAWQNFDTTPASWVGEEGKRAPVWQRLSDLWSWIQYQFSRFRWGQSNLRPYLVLASVPVLGYFLYQIVFHRRRHQPATGSHSSRRTNWPGLDSEFYQLEQKLAARGRARRPGEPLSAWLHHAAHDPSFSHHREPLQKLLNLHYRHRFDPQGLTPAERESLRQQTHDCLAMIR